jgi:multiple antibiotic resistance protein
METFDLDTFVRAFIALFVAMNTIGVLPLYLGLTEGLAPSARRNLVIQAITTAFAVAVVILLTGQFIFQTLGITVNDLRVGGGLILLVLSITDLLFSSATRRSPEDGEGAGDLGIVPLGIPLMVGPAAITTILVLQKSAGYVPTLAALVVNLAFSFVVFYFGPRLIGIIGAGASKAIAKVASLFLAAIAVALIRTGVVGIVEALGGGWMR